LCIIVELEVETVNNCLEVLSCAPPHHSQPASTAAKHNHCNNQKRLQAIYLPILSHLGTFAPPPAAAALLLLSALLAAAAAAIAR
jgi:hypothetical protein